MKRTNRHVFVTALLCCSTLVQATPAARQPMVSVSSVAAADSVQLNEAALEQMPIPLQTSMHSFTNEYLDAHGGLLESIQNRNEQTFAVIRKVLSRQGIPEEMLYLAVVESKMKNTATSGAGAAGIWQLMPGTARSWGLQVNQKSDQRRHIYHSSVAAAKYLQYLHGQFQDWLLVVAAYNCGEGTVHKAIKQAGSRDFWKLQRLLPQETRDHVKRFIATHYYYEGAGSVVTISKTEHNSYLRRWKQLMIKEHSQQLAVLPAEVKLPVRFTVFQLEEQGLQLELRR